MSRTIAAVACILVAAVHGTFAGCLVKKYIEIKEIRDVHILAFIKLDTPLHFIMQFRDQDLSYVRDWLELTNSKIGQAKVRGGSSKKTSHDLPHIFMEGWTKLQLKVNKKHVQLILIVGDVQNGILVDLELEYLVYSVYMEGTFSLCSEYPLEWVVETGEEVYVPLNLHSNRQLLQVTGPSYAKSYMVVPSADTNTLPIDVIVNSTLTIKTSWNSSLVTVYVFQGSSEKDDQALVKAIVSSSPILIIGVRHGSVHIQLYPFDKDSDHSTDSTDPVCTNTSFSSTDPVCTSIIVSFFCGAAFAILLAVIIRGCWWWCIQREGKKRIVTWKSEWCKGSSWCKKKDGECTAETADALSCCWGCSWCKKKKTERTATGWRCSWCKKKKKKEAETPDAASSRWKCSWCKKKQKKKEEEEAEATPEAISILV